MSEPAAPYWAKRFTDLRSPYCLFRFVGGAGDGPREIYQSLCGAVLEVKWRLTCRPEGSHGRLCPECYTRRAQEEASP